MSAFPFPAFMSLGSFSFLDFASSSPAAARTGTGVERRLRLPRAREAAAGDASALRAVSGVRMLDIRVFGGLAGRKLWPPRKNTEDILYFLAIPRG